MTKREIYNSEQNNTGFIHLYKEGMFYKAYEKSAFLLVNLVHAFKLSCNYVKLVGDYLVYAGFPISSLEKWCGNLDIEDKADYKEIQINGKDVLPVFGLSFRFNVEICQLCANLNRSYKYSLGEDLRKAALEILEEISQQLAFWEKSLQRETPAGMPVQ